MHSGVVIHHQIHLRLFKNLIDISAVKHANGLRIRCTCMCNSHSESQMDLPNL